jgi:hypothetical protein
MRQQSMFQNPDSHPPKEDNTVGRAVPGIEPGTSPTLRENHTTRPNSQLRDKNKLIVIDSTEPSGRRHLQKVDCTAPTRAHPGSNQGPADLQSAALPLSYIPASARNATYNATLHGRP